MTDKARRTAFRNRLDFDARAAIVEFPLLLRAAGIIGTSPSDARICLQLMTDLYKRRQVGFMAEQMHLAGARELTASNRNDRCESRPRGIESSGVGWLPHCSRRRRGNSRQHLPVVLEAEFSYRDGRRNAHGPRSQEQ
jgi:hypothetical protein